MGGCLGKTNLPETAAPWLDLPPEVAGHVFCRLPSHEDRLSFSAVCHNWRLAARQQSPLPPAMPCMNLGRGAYQSLVDGKVRRIPKPDGYGVGASFGGWLLYYNKRSGRCFLRAPFSGGVAIDVPTHYSKSRVYFSRAIEWASRALQGNFLIGRAMDMKIVVCSSRLVVALFRFRHEGMLSYLASFRPALLHGQSYEHYPVYIYTDIAFHGGNVFALSRREDLFCLDVEKGQQQQQQPIVEHINEARPAKSTNCYLVVSSDQEKLLMVRWSRRTIAAMDVWVFEADFGKGRWSEVKDLGDQDLFLGRNCSMAFAAGSSLHWGPRFVGGNRVFVLGTEWIQSFSLPVSSKTDIPGYCVYDMTTGETSLVSLKGARYMESCTSGWYFPHK
ncbi:unnamed protein product [Alopecurus aequalis]